MRKRALLQGGLILLFCMKVSAETVGAEKKEIETSSLVTVNLLAQQEHEKDSTARKTPSTFNVSLGYGTTWIMPQGEFEISTELFHRIGMGINVAALATDVEVGIITMSLYHPFWVSRGTIGLIPSLHTGIFCPYGEDIDVTPDFFGAGFGYRAYLGKRLYIESGRGVSFYPRMEGESIDMKCSPRFYSRIGYTLKQNPAITSIGREERHKNTKHGILAAVGTLVTMTASSFAMMLMIID